MEEPAREEKSIRGREVAITGRMLAMDREEAIRLLERLGARYASEPGPETAILVVGEGGWPLSHDGRPTQHLEKAQELQTAGHPLAIVAETEFLASIGHHVLGDAPCRLYTAQQLGRILNVPYSQVVSWAREGLIRPTKESNHLLFFDFPQVASAKALTDLVRSGVSPQRVRRALQQMERWWPEAGRSLAQLGVLEEGRHLLFQLGDHGLAEATGQLHFQFHAEKGRGAEEAGKAAGDGAAPPTRSAEGWLKEAVRMEEAGRLQEADRAYHQAMVAGGPVADTCFSLGKLLVRLGRHDAGRERFRQAVEIDPRHVEAWHSLGILAAEGGSLGEAEHCYRRALDTSPDYADAHYGLGEVLARGGRREEARAQWTAYLELDPGSALADLVRARLEDGEMPDR